MKKIDNSYSFIDKNTDIDGDFYLSIDLVVKGNIKGKIISSKAVYIYGEGSFTGKLKSENLVVEGCFIGEADCKFIKILNGGILRGNIKSNTLKVESKAIFEGKNQITRDFKKDKYIKNIKELETEFILL